MTGPPVAASLPQPGDDGDNVAAAAVPVWAAVLRRRGEHAAAAKKEAEHDDDVDDQATTSRTVVLGEKLKMPFSSVPYQESGGIGAADVEREVVQARKDARLLQVVDAVGEDAGGDDDQAPHRST